MNDSYRDIIGALLPASWSDNKKITLADQIVGDLMEAGVLAPPECATVEMYDALTPVETIEAYGLEIKLDANGDASSISRARWRDQHGQPHNPPGLVVVE